jgi:hypothetical protein
MRDEPGPSWDRAGCRSRLEAIARCRPPPGLASAISAFVQPAPRRILRKAERSGTPSRSPTTNRKRHRFCFVVEAAQLIVIGQHAGLDHLQSDGPVEADLACLVHNAHVASAEFLLNLVLAEVADGGAERQVARGPVAVVCTGRLVGVGRPVAGGVDRGRSRARDRPGRVRTGRHGVAVCRLGRVAGARGGGSCCGIDASFAGRLTGYRLLLQAAGAYTRRGVRGL